ncbi:MAG: class I SAM-dependent methyltransferase [Lachnospiraceae bacterium]|nr:class I SAM-dependent methyltransferase [Lachnospiraceae bacterium]
MNQTIAYYNQNAREFCDVTRNADMGFCRNKFLHHLKLGAHILDAGCGSGRDAKAFMDAGYVVTALDASTEICKEAEKFLGQRVMCMSFEEMDFCQEFDGIWACASLLHISKETIVQVLKRFRAALKENGILYASFKYGQGERREGERFFMDYQEAPLKELMEECCFYIVEIFVSQDVRQGRNAQWWVNVLARK